MAVMLEFEKPIIELEKKIAELEKFTQKENIDLTGEISKLTDRLISLRKETFENLTSWQKVQLARHPDRPYTMDYIRMIMEDYVAIHGDRHFGDDKALIAGLARVGDQKLMVIGHQKGRDINENLERNFGCAHPEGYRKAMRMMKMAEKYRIPIVTFVDTPGAYPGVGAEERGQAEAIAYNLREMAGLKVPIMVFVIGEGGSGGALGIGVGDRVYVLENAYYSVISPEGCAAILWKDRTKAASAAIALKLTAPELLELGIIDGMIPEPLGGAHRNPEDTAQGIKMVIKRDIGSLLSIAVCELVDQRYSKYRRMGVYRE
ncbi:MAG: acetyl-CoA carboxylase carboxyltransferase subunit alpha [Candidatus Omnitrophica bacterium]|nr:acetyl-CoA carboxylase carboxyltransferase subunit alpha [Candidatus Omnitrophota bacterium]MBU1128224.1 acetyl-CoA carboxylase carboxyltransferase subunit alpha [Candidatus Omnitrophota bacterium]MBU1784967.1 acetyl-CoA carboxylase carboxyltransferase subunit alpha [Candidatus Omnitrophota bacterium]MBU1851804.1 acetyl-CoA carboxylase carboxyltransferase subunit alpha [Candidatus Omnitrophota bacterium]